MVLRISTKQEPIDFITGIYIIKGKEGIFVTHVLELGLECVIVFIWKGWIFTQRLSLHKICDINCMESVVLKAFSNGDLRNLIIAQEGFPHSLTDGVEGRFTTRCQNGLVLMH